MLPVVIVGPFWDPSGSFWDHFGTLLGPFWDHFDDASSKWKHFFQHCYSTNMSNLSPPCGAQKRIVHQPKDADVVGARGGSWQTKHPGNLVYRDLVLEAIHKMKHEGTDIRKMVDGIIDNIRHQHGGMFLFQLPGMGWKVMDIHSIRQKVTSAIKNAESKVYRDENLNPPNRKWTVHNSIHTIAKKPLKAPVSELVPISNNKPTPVMSKNHTYKAKQGRTFIPKYTLKLLSLMCNYNDNGNDNDNDNYNDNKVFVVLDEPLENNETDNQRQMRLQLRHRYIAAQSAGFSPLTFSKKLIKLWGGTIQSNNKPTVKTAPTIPTALTVLIEEQQIDLNQYNGWAGDNGAGEPIQGEPLTSDVLFGRGGGVAIWEGNRRFRESVAKWKSQYDATAMGSKHTIAKQLVQSWKNDGGRFVERISTITDTESIVTNEQWCIVSDERCVKKAFQALRSTPDVAWNSFSSPSRLSHNNTPTPIHTANSSHTTLPVDCDFMKGFDDDT